MSPDAPQPNPKFAWRDYVREGLPKRSARERLADFLEIHGLMDEASVREQASRCIQCPNPSCVSGCPLCNPIPQWMQLTAEGRFLEASAVLGSVSNLAEICARLCPSERLCEHTCILDGVSQPVSIASIERFLADYALSHGQVDRSTLAPNGLKVAVLGSGPGCLVCADELAKLGYAVTVFDSALVPGGLMVNGTPAFRLDRSILQKRLDLLQQRGVRFSLGQDPSRERGLGKLREEFDAIYVGLDARQARSLDVPGVELPGVIQALPFLLQKNTAVPLDTAAVDLKGLRTMIIGGGDVAMDAARTALRCGARSVTCCYRRDEGHMPCAPHEYQNAREEGVQFMLQACPQAMLAGPDGRVRAVRLVRTAPRGGEGAGVDAFDPRPGTEFELEAECVILALGFHARPLNSFPGFEDLAAGEAGNLLVDEQQMTNLTGVFAGGDLVRGPSFVLETVRDARAAAAAMHHYLGLKTRSGSAG